jgi:putrescine---pyruvate transaminase
VLPRLLHPFAVPTREDFITLVRGEGALVWDDQGTEYVDGLASLWYVNVGHGRREIIDAVTAQMGQLATFHTFEKFANEPSERLATLVAERSGIDGARVFLANSGSEAIDTAMKLARLAQVRAGRPDKTVIISRERAYHGVNYGGVSAQGLPLNKEGWGTLLPDVIQVPADDLEAVAGLFASRGDQIAAVLTEPVQGAGGVFPPSSTR